MAHTDIRGQDIILGHARLTPTGDPTGDRTGDSLPFEQRPLGEKISELTDNLSAFYADYTRALATARGDVRWMRQIGDELLPLLEEAVWREYPSARRERPECVRRVRALARGWLAALAAEADGEADEEADGEADEAE